MEFGEVFERSLTLSHWRCPEAAIAVLGILRLTEAEISPGDALIDMNSEEKHFEETTGDEGASFERGYRRAALVLWPQS